MYNYTAFGDVNEVINDIASVFPAKEAIEVRKELYNDLNFDNVLQATEASINENTGVGKLLEIMLHTLDTDMHTKFEYVDKSKGDITKIKDFYAINAAIIFVNKIDTDYHYANQKMNMSNRARMNNLARMNDVYDILKTHKHEFVYGYRSDNNIIKNTYCVLVCVLVDLVCMNMIDVTQFLETISNTPDGKHPSGDTYKIQFNASRNGTYMRNVDKLIKIFHDGSWNKLFNILRNHGKTIRATEEVTAGLIIALIGAIPFVTVGIVYLIRFFIAFYFETAVNIKNKAAALSKYISEVAKYESDPKALYKQTKAISILNDISNFISAKILKEDQTGMAKVNEANKELRTSAYVSDADFQKMSSGSSINTAEIVFD